MAAAAVGSTLVGLSLAAPASAANNHHHRYQNRHADVTISGGEATAVNQCINNAMNGTTISQTNICNQISYSGNILILNNVTINVYVSGSGSSRHSGRHAEYSRHNAQIEATGGTAVALNACINDARDGAITQTNGCSQFANAGNVVQLPGVGVDVA
jgi:hypothetical protein